MNNTKNSLRERKGIFSGLTIAFAVAVIFLCVVGGTMAYFFTRTNNIVNTFEPGHVQCKVNETFTSNVKSSITVQNTGNTPTYMRVCLTTHWIENYTEDGVAKTRIVGRTATIPNFTLGADWVKGADGYYYYTKPVPPSTTDDPQATGNLLGSSITLATDGNFAQVVEVFAEAIQSEPDEAVVDAWGSSNGGSVTGVSNKVLTVQS